MNQDSPDRAGHYGDTVGRPMEILLVEDSLSDARLTIEALKDGDILHHLTLVCDGEEALLFLRQADRFARAPRPDVILLDLALPRKDGREILAEIKSDYSLKQIPVVILTASRSHEDILRGQMLQVEGYLTKPVNLQYLRVRVSSLFRIVDALKAPRHDKQILTRGDLTLDLEGETACPGFEHGGGIQRHASSFSAFGPAGADLRQAVMTGTVLRGTDFQDADLRNADLTDAKTRDIDVRNARLDGADLRGTRLARELALDED